MPEQEELEEPTQFVWTARLSPTMTRGEQADRYQEAMGLEAVKRQVSLARAALPKRKRKAN
jgi:hypothetical protein